MAVLLQLQKELLENGYIVVNDLIYEAECNEMQAEARKIVNSLVQEDKKKLIFSSSNEAHLKDDYFIESNDKIRVFYEEGAIDDEGNLTVAPNLAANKIGHALHYLNPTFRRFTFCVRMKILCDNLGFSHPAVVQSMYIFKHPGAGEVAAHQDATFLYTEPISPVGFWIALEDATVDNGCLWIAKGSHKSGVHRRLIRNPDKLSENKLIYNRSASVCPSSSLEPVPIKKGSCIILHGDVIHKSGVNKTSKGRPAYTFHIIEKKNNNYSCDNWLQEGPQAPFNHMFYTY